MIAAREQIIVGTSVEPELFRGRLRKEISRLTRATSALFFARNCVASRRSPFDVKIYGNLRKQAPVNNGG